MHTVQVELITMPTKASLQMMHPAAFTAGVINGTWVIISGSGNKMALVFALSWGLVM